MDALERFKKKFEKEDEHNTAKILGGLTLSHPGVANTVGGIIAIPSLKDLSVAERIKDQTDLDRFLKRYGLDAEIPKGTTVEPSSNRLQYEVEAPRGGGMKVKLGGMHKEAAMHELGHAQATNPISKARHANIRGIKEAVAIGRPAGAIPRYYAEQLLAPIDEAVAWKNAFKMPAAKGGRFKMFSKALPAYGSYLGRSAAALGGLGLIGSGLYGALTKEGD